MPKSHVTIQFRAAFPGTVNPGIVRSRLRKHLEDMGAVSFTEWFPDPLRCFQCNQPEGEELRLILRSNVLLCDGCRQEREPV